MVKQMAWKTGFLWISIICLSMFGAGTVFGQGHATLGSLDVRCGDDGLIQSISSGGRTLVSDVALKPHRAFKAFLGRTTLKSCETGYGRINVTLDFDDGANQGEILVELTPMKSGEMKARGFYKKYTYRRLSGAVPSGILETYKLPVFAGKTSRFMRQSEGYFRQSCDIEVDKSAEITGWGFLPQKIYPEGKLSSGPWFDYISCGRESYISWPTDLEQVCGIVFKAAGEDSYRGENYYYFREGGSSTKRYACGLSGLTGAGGYIAAYQRILNGLLKATGMVREEILPAMNIGSRGDRQYGKFDPAEAAKEIADLGVQRVWEWSRWRTSYYEEDMLTEEDKEIMGGVGLSHSLMFLEFSDRLMFTDLFCQLVSRLNDRGVDTFLWMPGGHSAPVSPLLKENPTWAVKTEQGRPYLYVYKDVGGNWLAAGYGDYLLTSLQKRRQEIPFSGVFLDSFSLFGLDAVDFSKNGTPVQFYDAVEFVRGLKRQGLKVMTESAFPLAIPSSTGIYNAKLIAGKEHLAFMTQNHFGVFEEGMSPEVYFKLLAFKACPIMYEAQYEKDAQFKEKAVQFNKAYMKALPYMKSCSYDEANPWVTWDDGSGRSIVFSYGQADMPLGSETQYTELISGKTGKGSTLHLTPQSIWLLPLSSQH